MSSKFVNDSEIQLRYIEISETKLSSLLSRSNLFGSLAILLRPSRALHFYSMSAAAAVFSGGLCTASHTASPQHGACAHARMPFLDLVPPLTVVDPNRLLKCLRILFS